VSLRPQLKIHTCNSQFGTNPDDLRQNQMKVEQEEGIPNVAYIGRPTETGSRTGIASVSYQMTYASTMRLQQRQVLKAGLAQVCSRTEHLYGWLDRVDPADRDP